MAEVVASEFSTATFLPAFVDEVLRRELEAAAEATIDDRGRCFLSKFLKN